MNKAVLMIAVDFLRDYANELTSNGCNDYELEATPENVALATILEEEDGDGSGPCYTPDGKLVMTDFVLVEHCATQLEALNLDDLITVLREADADLQGMIQRSIGQLNRRAAKETRRHIAKVYEAITGERYKP